MVRSESVFRSWTKGDVRDTVALSRFWRFLHGVLENVEVEQVWLSLTRALAVGRGFGRAGLSRVL